MSQIDLYPLRLEPIYQYRHRGGRRLAGLLPEALPNGPIGEAWIAGFVVISQAERLVQLKHAEIPKAS